MTAINRRHTLMGISATFSTAVLSSNGLAQGAGSESPDTRTPRYALGLKFAPVDQLRTLRVATISRERELPSRFDLRQFAPPIRSQGVQGSCVGWATAYATMSIIARRRNIGSEPFSPAFVYNRGMLLDASADADWPHCGRGMMIETALSLIQGFGVLPFHNFEYDESLCRRLPSTSEDQDARTNVISSWAIANDVAAVKQSVASGVPAVVGMRVGRGFMAHLGEDVFNGEPDYEGGHAMAIVGYDDSKQAWLLMNSWGEQWGARGFCWISYAALAAASSIEEVSRVFVVYPTKGAVRT